MGQLCLGCFKAESTEGCCLECGYAESEPRNRLYLAHRTILNNQYCVGRALGQPGGFGIAYLAWDQVLETRVAIKEYLPRDQVGRDKGGTSISPHSEEDAELFQFGLKEFLREARTLAKFNHPNIVRVRTYFESCGTGYMVMDYYEGVSLDELITQKGGTISPSLALELMGPIMNGLIKMHELGFLHRDIKPQNIYITKEGQPILLDFGAARMATGSRSKCLTSILSPGFAPPEQYIGERQGPWTDVYGCAATLYKIISGKIPLEPMCRFTKDALETLIELDPNVDKHTSCAVSLGLSLTPSDRPQTVLEFQNILPHHETVKNDLEFLSETDNVMSGPYDNKTISNKTPGVPDQENGPNNSQNLTEESRLRSTQIQAEKQTSLYQMKVGFFDQPKEDLDPIPLQKECASEVYHHMGSDERKIGHPNKPLHQDQGTVQFKLSDQVVKAEEKMPSGAPKLMGDHTSEAKTSLLEYSPVNGLPKNESSTAHNKYFNETAGKIEKQFFLSKGKHRLMGQISLVICVIFMAMTVSFFFMKDNDEPPNNKLASITKQLDKADQKSEFEEDNENRQKSVRTSKNNPTYKNEDSDPVDLDHRSDSQDAHPKDEPIEMKPLQNNRQRGKTDLTSSGEVNKGEPIPNQHGIIDPDPFIKKNEINPIEKPSTLHKRDYKIVETKERVAKGPTRKLSPYEQQLSLADQFIKNNDIGRALGIYEVLKRQGGTSSRKIDEKINRYNREDYIDQHHMKYKYIPQAHFKMGSTDGATNELPMRDIRLRNGFYIKESEVTQMEWVKIMGSTPWQGKANVNSDPQSPATYISLWEINAFINRLNKDSRGKRYRLPSEAEWEYACGGYNKRLYKWDAEETNVNAYAWGQTNTDDTPKIVGQTKANQFGLFDMLGNVWEMCADHYHDELKWVPNDGTAVTKGGAFYVRRGGGWSNIISANYITKRGNAAKGTKRADLGFRLVVVDW